MGRLVSEDNTLRLKLPGVRDISRRQDRGVAFACVSNSIVVTPETETQSTDHTSHGGWIVTVFNNEVNTYEEVISILMSATGCTAEEAWIETWEIDHLGSSIVHNADEGECNRVAGVIATIGIQVEVSES